MPSLPTGVVSSRRTAKLWPCSRSRSVAEKIVKWAAENLMSSLQISIVVRSMRDQPTALQRAGNISATPLLTMLFRDTYSEQR